MKSKSKKIIQRPAKMKKTLGVIERITMIMIM